MRGDPELGGSRPSDVAFPTHPGAPSVQLCFFFAKVDVAANIAVFVKRSHTVLSNDDYATQPTGH